MYDKPFFIREPVSNNAFSFDQRPGAVPGRAGPTLFVPALRDGGVDDVKEGREIVFEDYDDDSVLRACTGLAEFVRIMWGKKPVYVFDNHNHAFAFWHLEMIRGTIRPGATIIHVDRHKDSRKPGTFLEADDARDPEMVFAYTNNILNVGNFIPAAVKTGLAGKVINIDSEAALDTLEFAKFTVPGTKPQDAVARAKNETDLILDIDLDFFAPEMDYIPKEKKLQLIKNFASRAKMLTIATSPFFIAQDLALKCLREIAAMIDIN
jgi:hypothetical protein